MTQEPQPSTPPRKRPKLMQTISSRFCILSQSGNHGPGSPSRPNSPQITPSSSHDIGSPQNAPSEPEQMEYTSPNPPVEPEKMRKSQEDARPEIGSDNDVPNMDVPR